MEIEAQHEEAKPAMDIMHSIGKSGFNTLAESDLVSYASASSGTFCKTLPQIQPVTPSILLDILPKSHKIPPKVASSGQYTASPTPFGPYEILLRHQ